MAKVILVGGKLCCGKTTYALRIRTAENGVLLSCDELTLALFHGELGTEHDLIVGRAKKYLYDKSLELLSCGVSVILDWGFWTAAERRYAKSFYAERGIPCELHWLDVDDADWERRIEKRNEAVAEGTTNAYAVDAGLAAKFALVFQPPRQDEIDVFVPADGNGTLS